jgi:DNA-binding XRE family transcriptional regulator
MGATTQNPNPRYGVNHVPRYAHRDAITTGHYNTRLRRILHNARKQAGLTQKDLDDGAGLSRGFTYKFETGLSKLWVSDLMTLCSVLGIDASDVIKQLQQKE